MAVEPGLANQKLEPPAELFGDALDLGANVIEPFGVVAHCGADAGRRAIFAERSAQRGAPFAGGHAGFGAGDRGRHDVGAALRRAAQSIKRRGNRLPVALLSPCFEARHLIGFGFRRDGQHRAGGGSERRWLGFGETVDADHNLLAALDRLDAPGI